MSAAPMLAVALTPLETRHDVVLHLAERAERLGYDAFFLAEGWGHDAGVLLAQIASRTSTIRLGTGVVTPWGRSAASVAMLAGSLATVSSGRFILGLGSGSPALAEGLHGQPFIAPVGRLEELVTEVRRLLDGERATTSVPDGSRPMRLGVRSDSRTPVYLAALGPRAVRLCGRLADGWLPFLYPRSALPDGIRLLREGAARASAERPLPRVCPMVPLAVSSDAAVARAIASWWVVFYLTSMGPLYRDALTRMGFGADVAALLDANPRPGTSLVPPSAEALLDELTVWGDRAHARSALDHWYDSGAEMPVLTLPPGRDVVELDDMLAAMARTPS